MASPALYWTTRVIALAKSDILNAAAKIMKDKGMTGIKKSAVDTSGRTPDGHAVVAPLEKAKAPSPGGGLGTTAPDTYIVMIFAAGSDAKALRDDLAKRWDQLKFW